LVGLSLGYGLEFLLGLWLFFLGALDLEKYVLPWLAIVLFPELFYLSRLRCLGVAFVPMCWVCVIFFACVCVWVCQIRRLRLTIPFFGRFLLFLADFSIFS
jgi:hypothetical protein